MTQFKHIIVTVLFLIVLGIIANAQNTPRNPYEGATHSYSVNGISSGVDYEFFIAADALGSVIYDDGTTGEFDFMNSPTGSLASGESVASVDIRWNNGASLHIYELCLEVTDPGGCSNRIWLEVTPQVNIFDVLSENNPVDNTHSCPSINPGDGFVASSSSYNAGTTTLEYKVRMENGSRNWSFIPVLSENSGLSLTNYIISVSGTNSGVITPVGGRYTVLASDSEVLVNVSIENTQGLSFDVTLQATSQREEQTNTPDSDPTNDSATHTIDVLPAISTMGGV